MTTFYVEDYDTHVDLPKRVIETKVVTAPVSVEVVSSAVAEVE